jgi:hypothetical protein
LGADYRSSGDSDGDDAGVSAADGHADIFDMLGGEHVLAGQWVEPGGGVPAAALPGRKVMQMICNRDKRRLAATTPSARRGAGEQEGGAPWGKADAGSGRQVDTSSTGSGEGAVDESYGGSEVGEGGGESDRVNQWEVWCDQT